MCKQRKLLFGLIGGLLAIIAVVVYNKCWKAPKDESKAALASKTESNSPVNQDNTETLVKFQKTDDARLKEKVARILMKNPEIIVEAIQQYNQNQQRAQQEKLDATLMKYRKEIAKESSAVVLGKNDAAIKLVVFLDPNCPHCRPFSQALHKVRESFPNVTVLVRHWAILGPDSEDVVRGLWAIKQQGQDKFNAATKAIASSEERYTLAKLIAWAEKNNLDVAQFKKDADAKTTRAVVEETQKLASELGLEGTPTSLLINKRSVRLVTPTDETSLESILKEANKV